MQCEKCYNRGLLYNRCPSMGKGVTNPVVGGRMRDEGVTSALVCLVFSSNSKYSFNSHSVHDTILCNN